jgi:hypothetical protein
METAVGTDALGESQSTNARDLTVLPLGAAVVCESGSSPGRLVGRLVPAGLVDRVKYRPTIVRSC